MRAVLTYHSIDDSGSPISIAPAVFRKHIAWLASGAVRVMSLRELVAQTNVAGHEQAVAITFDDGFANFAEIAAPLLRDNGLPATVFVVSGHVGRDNQWGNQRVDGIPVLPLMSWDTLGRMAESGFEMGGHTRSHPHMTRLSGSVLQDEVVGGADDIEARLGVRPASFAYPYGDCNDAVAALSRQSFDCACTTEYRALTASEDPARVPRLDAWYFRQDGAFERWGSPTFELRVRARAGARKIRRLLRAD